MFNTGSAGVKSAIGFLESVADMLKSQDTSKVNISVKWDGCVHPDTILKTDVGDMTIIDIINSPIKINVLTCDLEKNLDEFCEAELPRINDNSKNWISIVMDNDEEIKITEDHEVYVNGKGWVQAKDLTENDDIREISKKCDI